MNAFTDLAALRAAATEAPALRAGATTETPALRGGAATEPLALRAGAVPAALRAPGNGRGTVYLVGAGPGDPELLTLRAARLLARADAVVYDHLVGPEVLALVGAQATRVYVGKQRARHFLPQAQINALLVRLAGQGRVVVRLKGGDPNVFGRGGEELQALAAAGVAVEVVPGITAACGAAACANIPLTHRDYAQACIFVTGQRQDGSSELDWAALARPRQTVVIYMGLSGLADICAQLVAHGLPRDWPAAVVANATLPQQRVVCATLATLAQRACAARLESPSLVIVGEVVRLRTALEAAATRAQRGARAARAAAAPVAA